MLTFGLAILGVTLQWLTILTDDITTERVAAVIYAAFLVITIAEVLRYILKRGAAYRRQAARRTGRLHHAGLSVGLHLRLDREFQDRFLIPSEMSNCGSQTFTSTALLQLHDAHDHRLRRQPVTDQARSLVIIEQFVGVFFVGVLIARLAGLYPPMKQ